MAQTPHHHCSNALLPSYLRALQRLACSALVNMTVDQPENKAKIGDLRCLNVWSAQIPTRSMTCRDGTCPVAEGAIEHIIAAMESRMADRYEYALYT